MTQRSGIKPSASTQGTVGPGSYNGDVRFYKPNQPYFSRNGLSTTRNKGKNITKSIRGNYEGDNDSDDEENAKNVTPGPGQYMTHDSTFASPRHMRTSSMQPFGSAVKRFEGKDLIDSGLGPGQYRARNAIGNKYNSVLRVAGSASFKSPKRTESVNALSFDMPGPGDYTGQQIHQTVARRIQEKKINKDKAMQFAVKSIRFGKDDTISPGPLAYKLPDSC